MGVSRRVNRLLLAAMLCAVPASAQYTDQQAFDDLGGAAEFARRRAELVKLIQPGVAFLFARLDEPEGTKYREDNDFYYFTGIADPGAVLVIDSNNDQAWLFEPAQAPQQKLFYGSNLLGMPRDAQQRFGFTSVESLSDLAFRVAQLTSKPDGQLWVRLGYPDRVDGDRFEVGLAQAMSHAHMFGEDASRDRNVIAKLRQRYPQMSFHDLVPVIDRLRNIKKPSEIEVIRRNGQLSAEGLRGAITHARPGMYEYQIAADAAYAFMSGGAQGLAYPPIVASGPNVTVMHYFNNRRQIAPNDLVVFDFAADLHHLTVDITRTFNIGGPFTPEQAKWYAVVLEAQMAVIDMLRPGNTYEQAAEAGRKVFERNGIADQWSADAFPGHFVGEATHDVDASTAGGGASRWSGPSGTVVAGQVVAVEPTVTFADVPLHIRIEDTVLITASGPDVLTNAVPKTMAAVEALVGSERTTVVR